MSVQLMLLGLLRQQPFSGYELQKRIEMNAVRGWSKIQVGSIYHGLNSLKRLQLIQLVSSQPRGSRQRDTFCITELGLEHLHNLLVETWLGGERSQWLVALALIDVLPKEKTLSCLDQAKTNLEHQHLQLERGWLWYSQQTQVSHFSRAGFENIKQHLQADLDFLNRVIEAVKTTEIVSPLLQQVSQPAP